MSNNAKVLDRTAKIVSVMLHPVFIPIYGTLMFFFENAGMKNSTPTTKLMLGAIVTGFMTIFPVLAVKVGMDEKKISDMQISNRKERFFPYLKTLIGYIGCVGMLVSVDDNIFPLAFLFLGAAVALAVIMVVTLFWKISAHACGMGGLAGGIFVYAYIYCLPLAAPFIIAVMAGGLVGWARIRCQAHSAAQVYMGWIVGFISVVGTCLAIMNAV